ncbi:ABC transporter substrate-binding protein [Saccharopolyspora sp. NPDC000359]|uniref:ABC transporter substrate-binding protein n=1 Tax=Saccharopolyspora sp. NPDC000359 TaxID=3154251 RepID=UPI0033276887
MSNRSPLIDAGESAWVGELPDPAPHTAAELSAVVGLLARHDAVTVGHSRDDASRTAAEAFAAAWRAAGGTVLATVDWPEVAASWLRPAKRMTADLPDAWVVAAAPLGFAQLARRLRHSTGWEPSRTIAFAGLQDSRLPALTGGRVLDGLRGATAGGGTWEVRGRWVSTTVV